MRYEIDHKQRTREKVVKVAAKAIRAAGPHRVGVAEVMSKAGLTHGGFYAHFESKDELIAAAIAQMFDEAQARLRKEIGEKPPAMALASYIDFYLSPTHRDAIASGCPIPVLAPELKRIAKPARDEFSSRVRQLVKVIAELLQRMQREQAEQEASSMVAELVGAISLARAEPEVERSNQILRTSQKMLKARFGIKELS